MYQVWVWDSQEDEWSKVSDDIDTWAEALNFARNRALKDMPWNVEIHEQDEDGETIERVLLEEFEMKRGGINNVIRCPECRAEFDYDEENHQGRCPECSYLIYEGNAL